MELTDKKNRDHPRVCGEKTEYRALVTAHQGSPPRMRGKGETACEVVVEFGITPAYAGKRLTPVKSCVRTGDHPRVCGEKFGLQV